MSGINRDIHLSPRAFKEMYNLRLLKFYNSTYSSYKTHSKVNFLEGLSDLSDELRSLIWFECPLQKLPSNFNPNNLIELDLCDSNLESLWEGSTPAPKLRWFNLSGCKRVTKIPDLSKSLLLEKIDLENCSSLLDFPQLAQHMKYLVKLDLSGSSNLKRLWKHSMEAPKLRWLNLHGCTRVTEIQGLSKSPLLESINLKDCSSLLDFPQLAQHLKNLRYLDRSGCNSFRSFPSDIHFESLTSLDLSNCSNLTKFGSQISGNNIRSLDLSGTAIKELHHSISHLNGLKELFLRRCENLETLPSSICKLTSLRHLDLSDCSRLEILPKNLGNLICLEYLSADRIAICQLPYSTKHIWRYPLRRLFLSDCNINYIPKDIGCLYSLVELDLSVNNFDGLPQSMRDLRKLESLHLDYCNGIVSLILPRNLTHLSACDCKQLQSIPNELDFALASGKRFSYKSKPINTKWFFCDEPKPESTEFIFTNCMNLEETAVGNMLARLVKSRYLIQEYIRFSFCYPGSEVPQWFRSTTEGSSIKFQDTFDSNLKGFAVCAVIAFEKYLFNGDIQHKLGVHFDGTCSDGNQSSPTNVMSETAYFASRNRTLIDSDHVAFAYCDATYRLKSCGDLGTQFQNYGDFGARFQDYWDFGDFGTQYKNYSFEFRLSEESPNYRLKSCGVCPIYFQDSDTDDSDAAGTSGSRFDEEEMEPHP